MKKAWIALAAVALVAFPASAEARGHKPAKPRAEAVSYCKQLGAKLGAEGFHAAYGSHALHACAKQRGQKLRAARKAALRSCRQQFRGRKLRAHGKPGGALRRCVRDKTTTDVETGDETLLDAVRECTSERAGDPAAFEDDYGDNELGRDAFAECVAEQADDDDPGDEADPGDGEGVDPEPGDEGDDTGDEPDDA